MVKIYFVRIFSLVQFAIVLLLEGKIMYSIPR